MQEDNLLYSKFGYRSVKFRKCMFESGRKVFDAVIVTHLKVFNLYQTAKKIQAFLK